MLDRCSVRFACRAADEAHYCFRCGPVLGLVLNSCLVQSPKRAPKQAKQQRAWLKDELQRAGREGVPHVIVFQHHPWFVKSVDEPDGYHNLVDCPQ